MPFDDFRCFEKSEGSRGALAYAAVLPKKKRVWVSERNEKTKGFGKRLLRLFIYRASQLDKVQIVKHSLQLTGKLNFYENTSVG